MPRGITRLPAIELPATQQALARFERVRPDLLGALTMKAAAASSDRRDPERHRADLVALCEALATSGKHVVYTGQLRPKDSGRLRVASQQLTAADWRRAGDPEAARGALDFLLEAHV